VATNEILGKTKVEYSFQSSVYAPTGNNDLSSGTPTVVDLTLDEGGTGLSDDAAVNSDQLDLGAVRPDLIFVKAAIEWFVAVTAGNRVDFWWSGSSNSGVGVGNPGHPDGVDGLYAPSGFTAEEGVAQMRFIGAHINNGEIGVQICEIGSFPAVYQYGQLVIVNKSGAVVCGTDDIESSVLLSGFIRDIQAAA